MVVVYIWKYMVFFRGLKFGFWVGMFCINYVVIICFGLGVGFGMGGCMVLGLCFFGGSYC